MPLPTPIGRIWRIQAESCRLFSFRTPDPPKGCLQHLGFMPQGKKKNKGGLFQDTIIPSTFVAIIPI